LPELIVSPVCSRCTHKTKSASDFIGSAFFIGNNKKALPVKEIFGQVVLYGLKKIFNQQKPTTP
jgi:hypothetical protein